MSFGQKGFVPDALEDDTPEVRIRWAVSELEKDRKYSIEELRDECRHWAQRLDHYATFCETLMRDPAQKSFFSSNGEIQGNLWRLDALITRIEFTEKTIRGLKENLLPQEKTPLVTARGSLKKKGKK